METEKMTISQTDRYVGIKQATKDGFIPLKLGGVADLLYPSSTFRRGRVQGNGEICPTIPTTMGICRVMDKQMVEEKLNIEEGSEEYWKQIDEENRENEKQNFEIKPGSKVEDFLVNGYGIFKLSPRECGRLMGVADDDITKMLAINSKTQCYKQFGNSIVVSVLMGIFSQLNIKGVTPWNELTDEQRYKMIYKGCEVK